MGRLNIGRGLKIKNKHSISTIFKSCNKNKILNKFNNMSKSWKQQARIRVKNNKLQRPQHTLIQNNWSQLYKNYVFQTRKRTKRKQIRHKVDEND